MAYDPRTLFTAGYGNLQPSDFIGKLKSRDINLVFDVRREDSRSWTSHYNHGYEYMGTFLRNFRIQPKLRAKISYWPVPRLANLFDNLSGYPAWLKANQRALILLDNLAAFIGGISQIVPCLICAELDHKVCHRTIVAEELRKKLDLLIEEEGAQLAIEAGSKAVAEWPCRWTIEHI